MHIKRLLAASLSAAMIVTSSFSSMAASVNTNAAADIQEEVTEATFGDSEESDKESAQNSDEGSEGAGTENGTATDDKAAAEGQSGAKDNASEEKPLDTTEDASAEETTVDENSGSTEASDEASLENSGDEEAADAASSELSDEIVEETTEDELIGAPGDPSACFEVVGGVLKVKDGEVLPASVTIPKEATTIPNDIFKDNKDVLYVYFENGSMLTTIEDGAFAGCGLSSIVIPSGVTAIGDSVFKKSAIKSITIGDALTSIGESAFQDCENLAGISASKVTSVGASAFSGCSKLATVNMPILETIGSNAFSYCKELGAVPYMSHLTSIGDNAFRNCGFTQLDLTDLPEGAEVGEGVFEGNVNLDKVVLSNNMLFVPSKMFYGCSKLNDVKVGQTRASKIARIKSKAFAECVSLKEIVFFDNTKVFESNAFDGCSKLERVTINAQNTLDDEFIIEPMAFPVNDKLVIYGYGGKVKIYCNKYNIKFESLEKSHAIVPDYNTDKMTVSITVDGKVVEKAYAGDEVRINVTMKDAYKDYTIKTIQYRAATTTVPDLVENSGNKMVFAFTMPSEEEVGVYSAVDIDIATVKISESYSGKLEAKFEKVTKNGKADPEGYVPDFSEDQHVFDIAGRESQFVVTASKTATNPWLWNYVSTNTSVATVTNTGIVRSMAKGTAKIRATLKNNSNKVAELEVKVGKNATIDHIELVIDPAVYNIALAKTMTVDGVDIPVIQFEKYSVKNEIQIVNAGIRAYDADDPTKSLLVKSEWSSVDTSIAALGETKTTANKNRLTVKKGALGETLITVKVKNAGESEATPANIKKFIIRVVDADPRLVNSEITVNGLSDVGTPVQVVPVYDYDIVSNVIRLTRYNSKTKKYDDIKDFEVLYDDSDDRYYIRKSGASDYTTKTFEGSEKLYLTGKCTGCSDEFNVPIKKLSLVNTALNPTIKVSGKLNLFYNESGDPAEPRCGKVTITQSIKDTEIAEYFFVSAANHKTRNSETPDKFANNFNIIQKNATTFEVTRSENNMLKDDKDKNVVSGYLYIRYRGFRDYVKKAVTIPTTDTAPKFALSKTSATASEFKSNQEYVIQLTKKDGKKTVVEDIEDDTVVGLTTDSTYGLFEEPVDVDPDNDTITLKVNGTPTKGKAVIYIQKAGWSRHLFYTFTLKTTAALPTVKLSSSTITLNVNYPSQEGVVKATENQDDAQMAGFDESSLVFTGNTRKYGEPAEELMGGMSFGTDTITVALPGDDFPTGSYSFKILPKVDFGSGSVTLNKYVTFKVSVVKKTPSIKLKKSTLVLNFDALQSKAADDSLETEVAETTFTFTNLPSGSAGTADTSDVEFIPAKKTPDISKIADVSFTADGKMKASLLNTPDVRMYKGKTFNYTVKNLKVDCSGDKPYVANFKISIKINSAAPAVSVKTANTINPIDATTKIKVTATVKNVVGKVSDVTLLRETGPDKIPLQADKVHFELEDDASDPNVKYIKIRDGKESEILHGKKYYLQLQYTLDTCGGLKGLISITVTPKQVIPSIKVTDNTATIYAGQADKTVTSTITIVQPKNKISANMTGVEIVGGSVKNIDDAFDIVDFADHPTLEDSKIVTIRLKNSSAIVLNKTYTINLATKYENQAPNTIGNKFSVKVTVRK